MRFFLTFIVFVGVSCTCVYGLLEARDHFDPEMESFEKELRRLIVVGGFEKEIRKLMHKTGILPRKKSKANASNNNSTVVVPTVANHSVAHIMATGQTPGTAMPLNNGEYKVDSEMRAIYFELQRLIALGGYDIRIRNLLRDLGVWPHKKSTLLGMKVNTNLPVNATGNSAIQISANETAASLHKELSLLPIDHKSTHVLYQLIPASAPHLQPVHVIHTITLVPVVPAPQNPRPAHSPMHPVPNMHVPDSFPSFASAHNPHSKLLPNHPKALAMNIPHAPSHDHDAFEKAVEYLKKRSTPFDATMPQHNNQPPVPLAPHIQKPAQDLSNKHVADSHVPLPGNANKSRSMFTQPIDGGAHKPTADHIPPPSARYKPIYNQFKPFGDGHPLSQFHFQPNMVPDDNEHKSAAHNSPPNEGSRNEPLHIPDGGAHQPHFDSNDGFPHRSQFSLPNANSDSGLHKQTADHNPSANDRYRPIYVLPEMASEGGSHKLRADANSPTNDGFSHGPTNLKQEAEPENGTHKPVTEHTPSPNDRYRPNPDSTAHKHHNLDEPNEGSKYGPTHTQSNPDYGAHKPHSDSNDGHRPIYTLPSTTPDDGDHKSPAHYSPDEPNDRYRPNYVQPNPTTDGAPHKPLYNLPNMFPEDGAHYYSPDEPSDRYPPNYMQPNTTSDGAPYKPHSESIDGPHRPQYNPSNTTSDNAPHKLHPDGYSPQYDGYPHKPNNLQPDTVPEEHKPIAEHSPSPNERYRPYSDAYNPSTNEALPYRPNQPNTIPENSPHKRWPHNYDDEPNDRYRPSYPQPNSTSDGTPHKPYSDLNDGLPYRPYNQPNMNPEEGANKLTPHHNPDEPSDRYDGPHRPQYNLPNATSDSAPHKLHPDGFSPPNDGVAHKPNNLQPETVADDAAHKPIAEHNPSPNWPNHMQPNATSDAAPHGHNPSPSDANAHKPNYNRPKLDSDEDEPAQPTNDLTPAGQKYPDADPDSNEYPYPNANAPELKPGQLKVPQNMNGDNSMQQAPMKNANYKKRKDYIVGHTKKRVSFRHYKPRKFAPKVVQYVVCTHPFSSIR